MIVYPQGFVSKCSWSLLYFYKFAAARTLRNYKK